MATRIKSHKWPTSEAAVITTDDLSDLHFLSPNIPGNVDLPEAIRYIAGCVLRWKQDDRQFVRDMIEWYSEEVRALEKGFH